MIRLERGQSAGNDASDLMPERGIERGAAAAGVGEQESVPGEECPEIGDRAIAEPEVVMAGDVEERNAGEIRLRVAKKHYDELLALGTEVRSVTTNRSLDALLEDVRRFSQEADFPDDVCIVGVELQPAKKPVRP